MLFAWGPRRCSRSPISCAVCTTRICAPNPRRSSSNSCSASSEARTFPKLARAWRAILAAAVLVIADGALAADPCAGHHLLRTRRPELSCSNVKPRIYPSPDGTLRAVVFPVDISLDATPDMESRVVIRARAGVTLASKDYSSPRGFNGYYVVNARWSPDSKFFVYSMASSAGHSPWQFPRAVLSHPQRSGPT